MTMKRFQDAFSKFKNIVLPEWTAAVFIFLVCFFSFGILLSRLGYFQDDWHHVFYDYWQGAAGLKSFLLHDSRPFALLDLCLLFPRFRICAFALALVVDDAPLPDRADVLAFGSTALAGAGRAHNLACLVLCHLSDLYLAAHFCRVLAPLDDVFPHHVVDVS